jgi:hypothetical protein
MKTIPNLEAKLARFGIHPKFFDGFRQLIATGELDPELGDRITSVSNYTQALDSLLAELSRPQQINQPYESLVA